MERERKRSACNLFNIADLFTWDKRDPVIVYGIEAGLSVTSQRDKCPTLLRTNLRYIAAVVP